MGHKLKPEALSEKYLKDRGFIAGNASGFALPYARKNRAIKKDLWGFADVVGIRGTPAGLEIILVQATSRSNVSARKKKILANESAKRLFALGVQIEIHGWDVTKPDPKLIHPFL